MTLFFNNIKMPLKIFIIYLCSLLLSCHSPGSQKNIDIDQDFSGWKVYAGTKSGIRYSSNDQINRSNVTELEVAWRYSTNDKDPADRSQNQCNPVVVNGILYGTSPRSKLFALDAATGVQKWIFDPASLEVAGMENFFNTIRGVVYWEDQNGDNARIFYSAGPLLYAIDANDGSLISSFGEDGFIDLRKNLDNNRGGTYAAGTTPGIIYKDLLIMGMKVSESFNASPGHIRAFDAMTGERRWIFHTIPHPGEFGYETWDDPNAYKYIGGANSWAGMALDEKRGIVYVPTGSAGPDFYGGVRKGKNLFANSLLALNAATGEYIWHYQTVHHDLWDRDLAANPNLVTLYKDGDIIDAVSQITKHGYIFLFDRVTGEPIFPIEEMPVPQNALPGEDSWPTQPFPVLPEPFARQNFTREDVSKINPKTYPELLEEFDKIKYSEMFTPPSKKGVWIFPGFDGGGEWGGAAVDPESQIMYVNSSELPWSLTMIDVPKTTGNARTIKGVGKSVYNKYCAACHGLDRKGNGSSFPALTDVDERYSEKEIRIIITNGRNMMPAFELKEDELEPLLTYILDLEEKESTPVSTVDESISSNINDMNRDIRDEVPYMMTGYNRFLDENGYPGITPPWGTLNAVHLVTGELLWKVPLGEYPELTEKGIPITGTENYGGPVVTDGGLVFIAATKDAKIRAFDKKTGEVLWEASLPAPGYATPATYLVDGKQYLVIACGGGKIGSKSGDEYVAFALPENE